MNVMFSYSSKAELLSAVNTAASAAPAASPGGGPEEGEDFDAVVRPHMCTFISHLQFFLFLTVRSWIVRYGGYHLSSASKLVGVEYNSWFCGAPRK